MGSIDKMNCRNWMDFVRFVFFAILDLQVAWPNSYVRTLVWGPWDLFGLARLSVVSVRLYQSVTLSILTRGFLVTGAQCWWIGKLRRHTWACCHCNRWWQHSSIPGRCVRRASLLPCLQRPDRQARVGWHNLGHCESWECLQSGPCGKTLITLRLRTKDQKNHQKFPRCTCLLDGPFGSPKPVSFGSLLSLSLRCKKAGLNVESVYWCSSRDIERTRQMGNREVAGVGFRRVSWWVGFPPKMVASDNWIARNGQNNRG